MKKIFFFLISSLLFFSCPYIPDDCDFGADYEFVIPVTLSPQKDTFRLGDTITIESIFSSEVFERKTQRNYLLEGFKFFPETKIIDIEDTISTGSALIDFEVIVEEKYDYQLFDYSSGAISIVGQYSEEDNQYKLVYKLVPMVQGLYCLSHFSLVAQLDGNQDFEGKCYGKESRAVVDLNGDSDNNIHYLNDSPNTLYNTWILEKPEQRFYDNGSYCFRVVE